MDRSAMSEQLMAFAQASGMPQKVRHRYVNCVVRKTEEMYPKHADVAVKGTDAQGRAIGAKCKEEIELFDGPF